MSAALIVTRDVDKAECHWLTSVNEEGFIAAGTTVYRCVKPTYGAVRDMACTFDSDGGYPFFELPFDAIKAAS